MEIIDERERKKKERSKGVTQAIAKVWELNGSLFFKPNLELALSIILKERELY